MTFSNQLDKTQVQEDNSILTQEPADSKEKWTDLHLSLDSQAHVSVHLAQKKELNMSAWKCQGHSD